MATWPSDTRHATYDDVNLMIKLYELRREERMREARTWFATSFKAKTLEEFQALCPPGSDENASFRMLVTYWDMVGSFLTSGVLNHGAVLSERRRDAVRVGAASRDWCRRCARRSATRCNTGIWSRRPTGSSRGGTRSRPAPTTRSAKTDSGVLEPGSLISAARARKRQPLGSSRARGNERERVEHVLELGDAQLVEAGDERLKPREGVLVVAAAQDARQRRDFAKRTRTTGAAVGTGSRSTTAVVTCVVTRRRTK